MRRYETICILRPGLNEEEISSVTARATKTITDNDGSIVKEDRWGLKKLAYPIKKEQQGHYVYLEYAGVPAAVDEIERVFRIDDRVIKYMTIKTQDVFGEIVKPEPRKRKEEDDEDSDD